MSSPNLTSWTQRYEVEPACDGWRLDLFLTKRLKRASRSQVKRWIKGGVRCQGQTVTKAGYIVRAGDVIEMDRTELRDPATPELDEISIIYDRPPWLVLNKPPGLLVHSTAAEGRHHVVTWLQERYPDEPTHPTHRLDRETSGCLLCARDTHSLRWATTLFEDLLVDKGYAAIVNDPQRRWLPGRGSELLATPLGFDPVGPIKIKVVEGSWTCQTEVLPIAREGDLALLEVSITQGRQHQIRAHLALEGTPIIGDKLYEMGDEFFLEWLSAPGDEELSGQLKLSTHALHAYALAWPSAQGGPKISVEAPLPAKWSALWAKVDQIWTDRSSKLLRQ